MFCKYCGTQLSEDAKFCSSCGKSLAENAPGKPAEAVNTQAAPAKKLELLPLIAAMVLGLMSFINLISNLVGGNITGFLFCVSTMGAAAFFVLTHFNILKKDNLFYAIGMFALAFSELLVIDSSYWWSSVLLLPAFAIAGLHYILKGKVFSSLIKMIMAIAVWAIGGILFIIYCVNNVSGLYIITDTFLYAASGLCIFSYSPYKK